MTTTTQAVTWVARQVTDAALREARGMAGALGLAVLQDEPGKLVVATADGGVLEYLTPERAEPAYLFDGQDTVVGFLVDDLDGAVGDLADAGFAPVGVGGAGGGVRFQHVRGPGGVAYGLIQRV
ncbi:MAG: hypothetical protein NT132_11610 [Microbacterium sp.]|uniref:hypothetical protein n=1 Tax=Microbacterium sp. TaxID=51671 RepID=UPI00260D01EC|nr:hypothetical protein [Microbacterium sp.]MCX6503028.1 hypothetical protein [Microbacterium sp.]